MNYHRFYQPLFLFFILSFSFVFSSPAHAQSVVLYQNDFNSPAVTPTVTCGLNLNQTSINTLYGTPGFTFQQINTAETVIIGVSGYSDPTGRGGTYALGMLRDVQDDRLSLTLNGQGYDFVNIQMDITTINPGGCGIPAATGAPTFNVRVYDSPSGTFNINTPGTLLDQDTISGATVTSQTVYDWTTVVISLDISTATDYITVYWDVVGTAPYAIFDNLIITASNLAGSVGGVNISQSGGSTDVVEAGSTDTYEVVLTSVPTQGVAVTATPDAQCDLGAGAGVAINLNFPATIGALTPQIVTVTAVDDSTIEGAHTCTITHTTTSLDSSYTEGTVVYTPSSTVVANITDNDPVSPNALTASITCVDDDLTITVTTGDAPFDISVTDSVGVLFLDDVPANVYSFTGPDTFSNISITEVGGSSPETLTLASITCPVPVVITPPVDPITPVTARVNVLGCALNSTDGVEVANAPDNTYCRVLMRDNHVVEYPGAIPVELINLGVVLAVDIYRLEGGQYINTFPDYARICLEGKGRYFFLDGRNAPRIAVEMPSEVVDYLTCAWVPAPGTAVLVNP